MNTLSVVILLLAVCAASASVLPYATYGSSYAAHAIDHSISYPAAPLVAAAPAPYVAAAPAPYVAAAPVAAPVLPAPARFITHAAAYAAPPAVLV